MFPATTPKTCAHVLTREEARDALSRVLRVCRESGIRKMGIPKRELVRCLYEQHMALGQSFILFIKVAESSRRFFDAIVDALKGTFPDVGQFRWDVHNKSNGSLPEETEPVMKCLDGLIAVCGTSGEKLPPFQKGWASSQAGWKIMSCSLRIYAMLFKTFLKKFQLMQLCQPMDG